MKQKLYKILHYPHSLLRKKSTPISAFTPKLKEFTDTMITTMYEFEGGGLAAPQVGVSKRIFIVDFQAIFDGKNFEKNENDFKIYDKKGKEIPAIFPMIFINPEIISKNELVSINWEGCLSLPNAESHTTHRFKQVEVHAQNTDGEKFSVHSSHLYASVCFQHEIDHLDGILLADSWQEKFSEKDLTRDIKAFENDPAVRKKLRKIELVEAHKIAWDFI